jgi:hypothetical protein
VTQIGSTAIKAGYLKRRCYDGKADFSSVQTVAYTPRERGMERFCLRSWAVAIECASLLFAFSCVYLLSTCRKVFSLFCRATLFTSSRVIQLSPLCRGCSRSEYRSLGSFLEMAAGRTDFSYRIITVRWTFMVGRSVTNPESATRESITSTMIESRIAPFAHAVRTIRCKSVSPICLAR